MRIAALLAASMAAVTLARATERPADAMTDEERKAPPIPQPNLITDANRPGETNRQFAARMKAERLSPAPTSTAPEVSHD